MNRTLKYKGLKESDKAPIDDEILKASKNLEKL